MSKARDPYAWQTRGSSDYAQPTFPFTKTWFDRKTSRPVLTDKDTPKAVPTGPKLTAGGVLVRDGSGQIMRRVPDFESILKDLQANNAQIDLPERTVFLGAQMASARDLLSQPGMLPPSVLTP